MRIINIQILLEHIFFFFENIKMLKRDQKVKFKFNKLQQLYD